jgi:hypothetical protein
MTWSSFHLEQVCQKFKYELSGFKAYLWPNNTRVSDGMARSLYVIVKSPKGLIQKIKNH